MKLSLQTDYALRTLIYLASRAGRATVEQISTFYGISNHHVAKVVHQLARHGYVRSIRGIGGGLELGRPAADVTIGEVILLFEGNMHLLECVSTPGVCVIQPGCRLKGVLAEAERLQMDYLKNVRLADVLVPHDRLVELATPPAAPTAATTPADSEAVEPAS